MRESIRTRDMGLGMSRDHHFRYRERPGRRHSLEALLEEIRLVALILLYNMY